LLEDIRILDLADESGSFCSRLLADLGASVIKIEKPEGDPSRKIGPFLAGLPDKDSSFFFAYHNSGKQSITLDIKEKHDRQKFLSLLENADVLIETFRPGELRTTGLSFKKTKKINPALIHLSISGFGLSGPRKNYLSNDLIASAFGGHIFVCGSPAGKPLAAFGGQPSYLSSLFGATNVLLAIRKRALTGQGCLIDLSSQEAVASAMDNILVSYFYDNTVAGRHGGFYTNSHFRIFPCKDGFVQLTLLQQWDVFVELLASEGMAGFLADNKWTNEEYRIKNIGHIASVVGEWAKKHTAIDLFETGQSMRFPWSPVFKPDEVMQSPQLIDRQFFRKTELKNKISVLAPGIPYRFSEATLPESTSSPLIDEFNFKISDKNFRYKADNLRKTLNCIDKTKSINRKKYPLHGIRVLDFTWMLAGPYATRILADQGAEVIKVQSHKTSGSAEGNNTGYFNTWNRNKRSITVDLSHPEARELILKLAAKSDVVVENFAPRVMFNWDLNYEKFKKANPKIIMAGISAMGQTGPWKDFVAYGPTFHALSGLTYLTSLNESSPVGIGHAYSDSVIGLYSALAILAALEHREKTGIGQYIDISGYEAVCSLLGPALMHQQAVHDNALFKSSYKNNSNIPAAPCGCYRCAGEDRWCVITILKEEQWNTFCQIIKKPSLITNERFSNIEGRKANRTELDLFIEEWTVKHTPEKAAHILQKAGIPAGVVQNAEDVSKDPNLKARNFFIKLTHPVLGRKETDSMPVNFCNRRKFARRWKAAPLLGEANDYVFAELLGFSKEEIEEYNKKGVIY
jgi:crotonobetainyl-CoA:carnitine CoA-transferase CaiB-like acyl-CoA transferase